MSVNYSVGKAFSGKIRDIPGDTSKRPKNEDGKKKKLGGRGVAAEIFTVLMSVYVVSLLVIYAAVGKSPDVKGSGLAELFSIGTSDTHQLSERAANAETVSECKRLTEEYEKAAAQAAKEFVERATAAANAKESKNG